MKPPPQGDVPSGRKRAIENLILRGQGHAKELEGILASVRDNPNWDGELARDLAEKVRKSFDETFSVLMFPGFELKEGGLRPAKRGKPNNSEGSEGSVHSSLATPRDRRGCYKRRSKGETWTEFSSDMNADGHRWRKYGQKWIHSAAHPRHYYRCTHKNDQGCLATKQVQKVLDDPITFRVVYQGHHTCNDDRGLKTPETVFDDTHHGSNDHGSNNNSSVLLSFEHASGIDTPPLKKEETGEDLSKNKGAALVVSSASSDNNNNCSLFGPHGRDMMSAPSSNFGDAASVSHHGSYLDMMIGWEDEENFMLDYGSSSGRGFDQF